MGQLDAEPTETKTGESRTVEPFSGDATGAVANMKVFFSVVDKVANDRNLFVKGRRFGRSFGNRDRSVS